MKEKVSNEDDLNRTARIRTTTNVIIVRRKGIGKGTARSHHQCLFVENVGKIEGNRSKMKILSSGVVFTFEEDINTSYVCLEGQQPIF